MANRLRKQTPKRRTDVPTRSDYRKYREELRADFDCHCGYCGDRDWPRKEHFEIDHFVPKEQLKIIRENDYSNLVYACRSCNNAKRAKWPTKDERQPNNGKCGWIDPCDNLYDEQFERTETGAITPKTELGDWMYENLKLWKKQHEVLWNYEQLEIISEEIKPKIQDCDDIEISRKLNTLLIEQQEWLKKLYEE